MMYPGYDDPDHLELLAMSCVTTFLKMSEFADWWHRLDSGDRKAIVDLLISKLRNPTMPSEEDLEWWRQEWYL